MAVTAQVNVKIDSSQAEKTVGKLNETINQSAKSANSLKAELRQTVQELQNLQPGTARFQELSARAGELRDQIQDTNAVVNQLAGNVGERLVRGVTNVVQIGVAGFQALQSGIALFGVESEEVQQTMVRLTALLNLSQAIETFAGLDQKIVEIRASFQSLTTATVAQTVAQEGENIATTQGVVATTALGAAMKALPIIAIVAALGTLAYGLYQYATASSEAEQNEKRRVATLKAQREEQEKQNETIAKESAGYVSLIIQLKATNAGSKERTTLIKQINATYGTTIKNLKDETAFQSQLNLEVANYIAFQKAKFQLQKNEELVQKNLEKQAKLQKELTAAETAYNLEFNKKLGQDDLYAGQREQNLRDYQASINRIKGELDAANKRLDAYGKSNVNVNAVINEITAGTNKYTEATNNNTDAKDDNVKATDAQITAEASLEKQLQSTNEQYTDTLKFIQDLVEIAEIDTPTPKVIDDLQKLIDARIALEGQDLVDVFKELGFEVETTGGNFSVVADNITKAEDKFGTFYESVRRTLASGAVQKSVQDFGVDVAKIVDEASKQLGEGAISKEAFDALIGITDQYSKFNKLIQTTPQIRDIFSVEDLGEYLKLVKDLNVAQGIIKYENIGGQIKEVNKEGISLSDTLKKQQEIVAGFQSELEKYYLGQLDAGKKTFEQSVKNQNLTKEQQDALIKASNESRDKAIEVIAEISKAQAEGVTNIVQTVVEEENQIRNFLFVLQDLRSKNIGDTDDLVKKTLLANTDLLIKETQKVNKIVLDEKKTAAQNLASFEEQMAKKGIDLTKFTEQEKLQIVQEYLDAQVEAVGESELDKLQTQLDNIDDYLAAFQSLFSDFESALTNVTEQENQKRTQSIQDNLDKQTALLDAQLSQRLITQEEYDNQVLQLQQQQEQEEREIAKRSFQTNKRLNLVGATIDGARAVLSTFANTPGELIIKSIAAALAGVFAATQIAVIAKSSFQAATGGIVPGMGSGEIDSVSATLAPGEAVINSKSTDRFLPILDAINQAGGGKSLMPNLPATNQGQRFEVVFPDNKQQEPVRAYVVEADITDAQRRVNRIENSTRF